MSMMFVTQTGSRENFNEYQCIKTLILP